MDCWNRENTVCEIKFCGIIDQSLFYIDLTVRYIQNFDIDQLDFTYTLSIGLPLISHTENIISEMLTINYNILIILHIIFNTHKYIAISVKRYIKYTSKACRKNVLFSSLAQSIHSLHNSTWKNTYIVKENTINSVGSDCCLLDKI